MKTSLKLQKYIKEQFDQQSCEYFLNSAVGPIF